MDIYNVDNNDTLMTTQTNDDAIPSCDNDEDLYTKMTSLQGLESSLADKGAILGHSDLEDPFILSEKSPCDLIVQSIAPMENLSLCASPLYHDIYTADSSNASNIPPQGTEMRDSDHVDKSPRRSPGRAKCLSPNKMSALLPTYTNAATRSSMIPNPPFIFAPFRERKILDDKGHSLMFPPNMIKVGALKVMTEIDMPAKLKINQSIPTTLPSELLMPKKLRCVFCQKFDSVCSSCHFKWRTIQDSRKTVLMKNIGSMPFLKRVGIFFATILVGNADFLECLLKEHKGTRSWCASVRVVPLKPKISNNVKKLLKSGRIFALHLACAFDCIESAKILLNAGIPYRNSETRHFPADFLPFPVTQEWNDVFQKSSQYREVVMSERPVSSVKPAITRLPN